MVQLDWLCQMRQARRAASTRSQRHDSFVSQGMAEVLEPRCLLSSVMSAVALDDAADSADTTDLDDVTSPDDSGTECPPEEEMWLDVGDETVDETNSSDNGEPVEVMFYSLGAAIEDSPAASPYFTEAELHDYLLNLAQQQWGGLFGQTVPQYEFNNWWRGIDFLEGDRAIAIDAPPMAEAALSSRVASDTNTQVSGVDEGDYVESDGRYIYVAHGRGLTIFDTADQLSVASEQALSGNVVGEFLSGDRLTIITQSGFSGGWYGGGALIRIADVAGGFAPGRWAPQTTVTVWDVADRTAPTIVTQTTLDGGFRDARAVDGIVYIVLENSFNLPEPLYTETPVEPDVITDLVEEDSLVIEEMTDETMGDEEMTDDDSGDSPEVSLLIDDMPVRWGWWNATIIANRTYESLDDYLARVGDQITSLSLPHAFRVDAAGNSTDLGPLTSAENIVRPQSDNQQSLLTVVTIDAANASTDSGVASSTGLMTAYGSTVYMTREALYVATTEFLYEQAGYSTDTRIDRFAVAGTNVTWQASGVVPGVLINQFAMDEQGGFLHVATHVSAQHWTANDPTADDIDWNNGTWTTQNDNGVYVLDTDGDTLDEVGSVTGLAPGEQLYAARFIGDTAYLVTFLQTDPLFAIDLSDPTNPTVQGELVIPGFSNYLQSVGEGLLLGIGQEREEGTWNSHLHVSLFDVSDGAHLTQIARQFLDESSQWSSSDAQYDHHALLYSAEDGLLVLPVNSSGIDQETGNYHFEQLLEVLHVDANGIEVLGEIRSDHPVFRTVRIDNVLYAITEGGVTAYSLEDFSVIGQADLSDSPPWYYPVYLSGPGSVIVQRGDGGGPVPVNSAAGAGNSPDTVVAIPSVATFIAASTDSFGGDQFRGSSSNLVAAQLAQNTANSLARFNALPSTSNTESLSLDSGSRFDGRTSFDADNSPRPDRDGRSEVAPESSSESDGPSFDEFWKEFTQRLRNGTEPMPTDDAAPNSESPKNAEKAATKTETPTTRNETEGRQSTNRTPEMSQRVRPAQRGSAPVVSVRSVTKSAAVKSPTKTRAAQ